jgi:hypothetical protein
MPDAGSSVTRLKNAVLDGRHLRAAIQAKHKLEGERRPPGRWERDAPAADAREVWEC